MRCVALPVATLFTVTCAAACGSDGETTDEGSQDAPTTTLEPTECLPGEGDMSTTIKISVDDPGDGAGFVASRTPSDLLAGKIRVELESDKANTDPVDVPLLLGSEEVFRFVAVEPGTTCGVQLQLAAGDYRVVVGDSDAEFTIGE